jgi:putative hydrolase of the HAD superfamily
MKTVFFDFGRTLVCHPEDGAGEAVVRRFGLTDSSEVKLVRDAVFSVKGAVGALDNGEITRDEYKKTVLAIVPEHLREVTEKTMDYPISWLPMIDGMEELLIKLKSDGFKLCIASNMDTYHAAQMRKHPILAKYFDEMVFSAEIKVGKPSALFYEKALDICGEKAENVLFIDDLEANVRGAEAVGIKSLLFKGDAVEAQRFIYENKQ